jgi:outer membrane murein-binding lipoprotein Lpp/translation initiation factor IF-1
MSKGDKMSERVEYKVGDRVVVDYVSFVVERVREHVKKHPTGTIVRVNPDHYVSVKLDDMSVFTAEIQERGFVDVNLVSVTLCNTTPKEAIQTTLSYLNTKLDALSKARGEAIKAKYAAEDALNEANRKYDEMLILINALSEVVE